MIIPPEGHDQTKQPPSDSSTAHSEADTEWQEEPAGLDEGFDEPPPSYSARADDSQSSSSSHPPPRRSATAPAQERNHGVPNATNYQFISKVHGSIEGRWTIDPMHHVPASLLPALRHGESATTRPNLRLETMNGNISADVTLISSARKNSKREKAILYSKTSHGNVAFKVDVAPSEFRRLPVELMLETCHGNIEVCLPRCFRGFITATTLSGGTSFSEGVTSVGHLVESGGTTKMFVGDYSEDADDLEYDEEDEDAAAPEWKGDRVAVHTMHGTVSFRYVDEDRRAPFGNQPHRGGGPSWLPPRRGGLGWIPPIFNPFGAGAGAGAGGAVGAGLGRGFPFAPGVPIFNPLAAGIPRPFQARRAQTSGFMNRWR